ncbi:hypothetical protein BJV77DRAFT_1009290 [Russula vinacea]|nr:hypothetical protein BJV77DRAFT_1009290 [Russula vinacea]
MSSAKSALIFGATGQTGRHLLRELIESRHLPVGKVEQKVIDFERLEEAGLKEGQWDVIFIAMGTTAKSAGSQENFTKIDKEYVVNAAKAAKADKDQRLIYVSVSTAHPKSSVFYSRSKALTEQALAELGYKDTIMFRPAVYPTQIGPISAVTGVLSRFSSKVQIDVDKLAKSIRIVGEQGTTDLPSGVHAQQKNWGGKNFTMIDNSSALALSH